MTVGRNALPKELLDSLLADCRKSKDLIGEHGLLKQLTKLLVEKALEAELTFNPNSVYTKIRTR